MLTKPILVAVSIVLLGLAMLWAVQTAPPLFTSGHLMSPQFTSQSSRSAEERQLQADVEKYLAGFAPKADDQEEPGPRP